MHEYRINIAQNGRHCFRVILGEGGESSGNEDNVRKVFNELRARFPAHEGYSVTMSRKCNAMYDVTEDFTA